MTGVYIGTSPLKSAYVGTTPVKEIYVGTTKVRPSGWIPGSNCLAYYKFETDVLDYTSNGRNATKYGCSFGTVGGKKGIRLQTSYSSTPSDYITTPVTYTSLPFSMCVWIYPTTMYDWQCYFCNSTSQDNNNNIRLRFANSNISNNFYGNEQSLGSLISTNQRTCVGVTIDASRNGIFYINGTQSSTFTSGTNTSSAGAFKYGYSQGRRSYVHPFVGWIRQSAIFNAKLTASEMADFYNLTA